MNVLKFTLKLLAFLPHYGISLLRSNLQVIHDVITAKEYARPAVLEIPLQLQHPGAIFLLANLITMTPGTVCLDVSEDRRYLYVHVMFYNDKSVRTELRELEQKIGELFT